MANSRRCWKNKSKGAEREKNPENQGNRRNVSESRSRRRLNLFAEFRQRIAHAILEIWSVKIHKIIIIGATMTGDAIDLSIKSRLILYNRIDILLTMTLRWRCSWRKLIFTCLFMHVSRAGSLPGFVVIERKSWTNGHFVLVWILSLIHCALISPAPIN